MPRSTQSLSTPLRHFLEYISLLHRYSVPHFLSAFLSSFKSFICQSWEGARPRKPNQKPLRSEKPETLPGLILSSTCKPKSVIPNTLFTSASLNPSFLDDILGIETDTRWLCLVYTTKLPPQSILWLISFAGSNMLSTSVEAHLPLLRGIRFFLFPPTLSGKPSAFPPAPPISVSAKWL